MPLHGRRAEQRSALAVRDGGCLWPDCEKPVSHTEAHHVDGWAVRRTGTGFWLVPPEKLDPAHTPIAPVSKAHWMPRPMSREDTK